MQRIAGLKQLAPAYDTVLCDVWGVLHDGVAAFPSAVDALRRFRSGGGRVVLLTNAPRPHPPIREQLRRLHVSEDAYDDILTSGDVTRGFLARRPGSRVFHLGPDRDSSFYDGLPLAFTGEAEAELVSCTGLLDDTTETPEHYRALLGRLAARGLPFICANPDLVVDRGGALVPCAGALAALYAELGGEVVLAGKPHAPIYEAAADLVRRLGGTSVLAIGDGLPTDIRGATDNGLPALFVTGGIHAADFGPAADPDAARVAARLRAEGLQAVAHMPVLAWDGE